MEKVKTYEIQLVAGKNGLDTPISWVHMVETKEAATFLDGGEITFVTGIGISEDTSLFELIKEIRAKKAAAVVINIGPYIKEIPNSIIMFCNENAFPLYTVPWKIHLVEIIKVISYTISKDDQHNIAVASAFKNAINFPKQEELYVVSLSQHGFQSEWSYYACAINIFNQSNDFVGYDRLENIASALLSYLNHNKHSGFTIFSNNMSIIIIIANHTDEQYSSLLDSIQKYLKTALRSNEHTIMGVGRSTKSIRCLYKSYNQALAIQKLHQAGRIDPSLISYKDMGIYRLLIGIEDNDIIKDYYMNIIGPLEEYDTKNNSDLCDVLKLYLNKNGSVKDTADEMFVHRNTINYKLVKISEILKIDLQSLDTRLQLALGFMLKDMLA